MINKLNRYLKQYNQYKFLQLINLNKFKMNKNKNKFLNRMRVLELNKITNKMRIENINNKII